MIPDSKVHVANMWPTWGRQDPVGPHVDHMNLAIWDDPGHLFTNVWRRYFHMHFIERKNGILYKSTGVYNGPFHDMREWVHAIMSYRRLMNSHHHHHHHHHNHHPHHRHQHHHHHHQHHNHHQKQQQQQCPQTFNWRMQMLTQPSLSCQNHFVSWLVRN